MEEKGHIGEIQDIILAEHTLGVGGSVEVDVQNGFWHYKYLCVGADLRD